MKKLFLGSFALFLTVSAFSQNGKVISAFNYLGAYTAGEGAANLEEAAKNIDIAVNDPSTAESSKAWWYRSNIYQSIASEKSLADKFPKASLEAVHSFQKLKDLNDPKFKDWSDAYSNIRAISNNLFNDGITAYNKKNYHDAYLFFFSVSSLQDILDAKGQKEGIKILSSALGNAALCAENDKDYPTAIATYKRIIPISKDSLVYISLVSVLKKTKDIESAKAYTDEALAKYPNSKELLIDKINFFISDGKFNDAIAYLQKAIAQDPKNEQLQSALGVAYEQIKDTANARKTYENLLLLNPNSFEANYGIGGMIFNKSKPIQEKMNALGATKEDLKKWDELKATRDAVFLQAQPYLQKAQSVKPEDPEVKKALTTIQAMIGK
jgi:tetratricopeptide (TPR) repeat protein